MTRTSAPTFASARRNRADPSQIRSGVCDHADLATVDRPRLIDDLGKRRRNHPVPSGRAFWGGKTEPRRDVSAEVDVDIGQYFQDTSLDLLVEDLAKFERERLHGMVLLDRSETPEEHAAW